MTANNGHLLLSSSFSRFLVFGRGQVHTKAPALPTLLSAEMLARFSISLLFFFFAIFPTSSSCRRLQQESLFAPTQSPLPAEPPFSSFPNYPYPPTPSLSSQNIRTLLRLHPPPQNSQPFPPTSPP
ncbi:hypothetical protein HPP92_011720 [Vanilla planifolia]|uniref:Uncharacterized protein n=1 Tax=Vanilla planifolia TaxID=51239 RepID=A0A835V0G0_VANPL|nr:hypothetical protein HPP92_011720 [Vanilla planifolia]